MAKSPSLQRLSAWMRRFIGQSVVLFSFCLYFSLVGCSVLGPVKTPADHQFALSANTGDKSISAQAGATLLVSNPIASPGYDSTDMIYVERPYQLSHYANNRWISPPADMLGPILQQKLHSSGCFRAVVTPPSAGTTDFILNTQLLALQQEFTANKNQVRFALTATLINNATQQIIVQRRLEAVVLSYQRNPYSGVIAANLAVSAVTQKLADLMCHYGASGG